MVISNYLSEKTLALADRYVLLEGQKSDLEELRPQVHEALLSLQEDALLENGDVKKLQSAQAELADVDQKILAAESGMLRIKDKELSPAISTDLDVLLTKLPDLQKRLAGRQTTADRRVRLAEQALVFLQGSDPSGVQTILKVLDDLRAQVTAIASDPESLAFGDLKEIVAYLVDVWNPAPERNKNLGSAGLTAETYKALQTDNTLYSARRTEKANQIRVLPGQVIKEARKRAGVEKPGRKKHVDPWFIKQIRNYFGS